MCSAAPGGTHRGELDGGMEKMGKWLKDEQMIIAESVCVAWAMSICWGL